MELKTKIRIDRWLGYPLVSIVNTLAFLSGKLLKRHHDFENSRVIVVCKLLGLGSIVQITPLLVSLRKRFPSARLVFLTEKSNIALCNRLDIIDETIALEGHSLLSLLFSFFGLLKRFWRMKVDIFMNLEIYSQLGSLLAVLSCARNRIGYYQHTGDIGAHGIYTHMVYFNKNAPIAQIYLQAARCLGITQLHQCLMPPRIDSSDQKALMRKLESLGSTFDRFNYMIVNPNASDLCKERRWPVERYAFLINRFHKLHPDMKIYLIGGRECESVGSEVVKSLSPLAGRFFNFTGQLSLPELTALISGARIFVTNDSGPMHLAFALGTPTVALFGPVTPKHYGGTDGNSQILLFHHVYCSPCVHHFLEAPCRGDNQCMKLISVDDVSAAIEVLLTGKTTHARHDDFKYSSGKTVFGIQNLRKIPGRYENFSK
jgi:ADP-heptose:LPS heptosyltransferase